MITKLGFAHKILIPVYFGLQGAAEGMDASDKRKAEYAKEDSVKPDSVPLRNAMASLFAAAGAGGGTELAASYLYPHLLEQSPKFGAAIAPLVAIAPSLASIYAGYTTAKNGV